jgi:hypothetical protein
VIFKERARAKELAMRERETQELLKMGTAGMDKKKTKSFGKVRRTLHQLKPWNCDF